MDELDDLLNTRLDNLNSIPDEFISAAGEAEKDLFETLLSEFDSLETKNGKLVTSGKNFTKINSITSKITKHLFGAKGIYFSGLKNFVKGMKVQSDVLNEYYTAAFPEFEPKGIYEEVLKASTEQALELFDENAMDSVLVNPMKAVMRQAIGTEARTADTILNLRTIVEGDGKTIDGRMSAYIKRTAHDSFAITDAGYNKVIADALDVQWYKYAGNKIDDTRQFCLDHVGKFFHKKEIEKWASLNWQGKNKATNETSIFLFRGGWNCRHAFGAISQALVPSTDVARAKKEGYL